MPAEFQFLTKTKNTNSRQRSKERRCCLSKEEKEALLSRKLTELGADELGNYAADVFLTVGGLPDFTYFLPRILELSLQGKLLSPDLEVVLEKLSLADWNYWSEIERMAILQLLDEKFAEMLEDPNSDGSDVDEWVCALGRCVKNINPYLDQLFVGSNEDKLLSFVEWNLTALTERKVANGFWKDAPENQERLVAWLNEARITRVLSDKYGMVFEAAC